MVFYRNIIIILFLSLAFSVAFFEKQFFPYLKIQDYSKHDFGFELDFSPRWVPFFPFSSMPMYSELFDSSSSLTHIELVAEDSNGVDFVLSINKYFYPLWPEAFREIYMRHIYDGMSKKEFLSHFLLLYLNRKASGNYQKAPVITKIKAIAVTWSLDEWVKLRINSKSRHDWYGWRDKSLKPLDVNVLSVVTPMEALSYVR